MKRLGFLSCILVLLAALHTSCDIHEYPHIGDQTAVVLNLNFDTVMPIYKEVSYAKDGTQRVRANNNAAAYDTRHIVSVHRLLADGSYDRDADTIVRFTCDPVDSLNCSRVLTLREGDYKFFVWTDFVSEGTSSDLYYDASDFTEIALRDQASYIGNCDYRDAYRGEQTGTITVQKNEIDIPVNEITVEMERPLAKFQFISTDYEEFVRLQVEEARKRAGLPGAPEAGESESTEQQTVNIDDYKVVFHYMEFMPCSFNMFTNKPADSWVGVQFEGLLRPENEQEVSMGFDYVFVNGKEAGVAVMVEVYNKAGEKVSSSPTINVPLIRGHLTIVRGEFLTSMSNGGVVIDPGFDGEYNIEIK